MNRKRGRTDGALKKLREFGLRYPGAYLKSPWPGHLDLAVKDKTFAFLSAEGEPFSISCKLPESNALALLLPFCEPTGYGLGKSGWVSAKFPDGEVPVALLEDWIDESYRAQAPKKLVKELPPRTRASSAAAPAAKATAKSRAAPAKAARKAPRKAAPAKKRAAVARRPKRKAR